MKFETREDVFNGIKNIISGMTYLDSDQINQNNTFGDDLNFDSLDDVEFVMEIEDTFDICIPDEEAEKLKTVKDCVDYVCKRLEIQEG